ncbi:hypothetical protein [Coprobacter sp.]
MISLYKILESEVHNKKSIYLYKENDILWKAYEHSAYILSKIFPDFLVKNEVVDLNFILCTAMVDIRKMKDLMTGTALNFHDDCLEIVTNYKYKEEDFIVWKSTLPED